LSVPGSQPRNFSGSTLTIAMTWLTYSIVVPFSKPKHTSLPSTATGSHGERDVPVTKTGNLLVCECVCNTTLFKANEQHFYQHLRSMSTLCIGKERVRKTGRTLDFVYAPDSDWYFCCTCGLHASNTPGGRSAPWNPTAPVVIDPNDWQPRPRRQPQSFGDRPKCDNDSEDTDSNSSCSTSDPELPAAVKRKRARSPTPTTSDESDAEQNRPPCPWNLRSRSQATQQEAASSADSARVDPLASIRDIIDEEER